MNLNEYHPGTIADIQRRVGAIVDESFGPSTLEKILQWTDDYVTVEDEYGSWTDFKAEWEQSPKGQNIVGLSLKEYDYATICDIQRRVGADEDGILGPDTIKGLTLWDDEHGQLPWADFKIKWEGSPELSSDYSDLELEIWWDDDPAYTIKHTDKLIAQLKKLNVGRVALMMDRSEPDAAGLPVWRWKDSQLIAWTSALKRAQIGVTLTCWPRPTPQYLNAQHEGLARYLELIDVRVRIEADLEGQWRPRHLEGFEDLDVAGAHLIALVDDLDHDGFEVTSYVEHGEFGSSPTAAHKADSLYPQAYSRFKKGDPSYQEGATYGPGGMQNRAINRAEKIEGPVVCCALAAFDQTGFLTLTTNEAMLIPIRTIVSRGIKIVRYWSSKWIIGARKNDYAYSFLLRLMTNQI